MKRFFEIVGSVSIALLITACGGASAPITSDDDVPGENPERLISVEIRKDESLYRYVIGDTNHTVVGNEWRVDQKLQSDAEVFEPSLSPGEHNISLKIVCADGSVGSDEKKVIVDDEGSVDPIEPPVTVHVVEIELEDPMLFGTAQYYSIDRAGHLLFSEDLDENDLIQEEDHSFLILSNSDDGAFYSHLTVKNKDGSLTAYSMQEGIFKKLPVTIILNDSKMEVDDMSGLYSLSFEASTSTKISSGDVKSFLAIVDADIDGGFFDSGYNHFDDETVYEWSEDGLKMKSFALGYTDPHIRQVSICVELAYAAPKNTTSQLVCSNMLSAD